ncbi:unnamed protein product, partial [Protopolystoma xenopodis]
MRVCGVGLNNNPNSLPITHTTSNSNNVSSIITIAFTFPSVPSAACKEASTSASANRRYQRLDASRTPAPPAPAGPAQDTARSTALSHFSPNAGRPTRSHQPVPPTSTKSPLSGDTVSARWPNLLPVVCDDVVSDELSCSDRP